MRLRSTEASLRDSRWSCNCDEARYVFHAPRNCNSERYSVTRTSFGSWRNTVNVSAYCWRHVRSAGIYAIDRPVLRIMPCGVLNVDVDECNCAKAGLLISQCVPLFWNFWKPGNVREFCKGQGNGKGKVREKSGNLCSQGIWLWHLGNMLVTKLCSEHHITYLYFIPTLMRFAYLMFSIVSWL